MKYVFLLSAIFMSAPAWSQNDYSLGPPPQTSIYEAPPLSAGRTYIPRPQYETIRPYTSGYRRAVQERNLQSQRQQTWQDSQTRQGVPSYLQQPWPNNQTISAD